MMAKIKIEWISDSYSGCEDCGTSYADGAKVYVDDILAVDLEPVAHCHGGAHYSEQEVYDAIIQHLGHTVEHT